MRISRFLGATVVFVVGVGCPGGADTEGGSATTGTGGSTGESTGAGTMIVPTTTDGPGADSVIAPVICTFLPLGGAPIEQPFDPLTRYETIEIAAGEAPAVEVFPAVYDGSTQLEFVGVPAGPYRLRQQYGPYPEYPAEPGVLYVVLTDARELGRYGDTFAGRPDVAHSKDTNTRLAISATGMQALSVNDEFEVYSYNADAIAHVGPLDGTDAPAEGATALDGWKIPWRPGNTRLTWPLVDPTKGDDLWLAHQRGRLLVAEPDAAQSQDPWSYAQVATLIEVAELSAGVMAGGATAAASGSFSPVATEKVSIDLRVDEFLVPLQSASGAVVATSCYTAALLEAGTEHPIVSVTPGLGSVYAFSQFLDLDPMCPFDGCDPNLCASCEQEYKYLADRVFDLEYANPYPGGTELVDVTCTVTTFVPNPVTFADERLQARFSVTRRLADAEKQPFVPEMGLVGDLRVNGEPVDPDGLQTGVGATPTITFSPPGFGAPDYYTITVWSLEDLTDIDGNMIERHTIGSVSTLDTSVTLPEGLMQPGSFYYLQVVAYHGSELDGDYYTFEIASSTAITGLLAP